MATLIILAGLPGTGKTYTCKIIQSMIKSYFFDSDKFAKNSLLFKRVDANKISLDQLNEIRLKFYNHKIEQVESLLRKYDIVVMDAVFDKNNLRQLFYGMIQKIKGKLIIIEFIAPDEIVRNRILNDKSKIRPGSGPDSRLKVYEMMKKSWEKIRIPFFYRRFIKHYKLNSDKDVDIQVISILSSEGLIKRKK